MCDIIFSANLYFWYKYCRTHVSSTNVLCYVVRDEKLQQSLEDLNNE